MSGIFDPAIFDGLIFDEGAVAPAVVGGAGRSKRRRYVAEHIPSAGRAALEPIFLETRDERAFKVKQRQRRFAALAAADAEQEDEALMLLLAA